MKIDGTNRVGSVNQYKKAYDSQQLVSKKSGNKKDHVEISTEAKELLGTHGTNDTRQDKIETLKKSVADGTYRVDGRKIAEKLFPFLK
ncbi:flagellar biosynthesis anti-sigma factor FlgM [Paenibacillus allorhizosphaerae]|uniref:Anti-sigma-28 factor FlgM C-terminal domain-containing protein n=1 Tax=Paenibacillus allorhizosphaerae TaxID=2849866 RepID=A0ABN7TWY4_9BACL|nr:flagellar biosynthesis anti-sigma factor FlgM [Paenibacillus allorhizosphaerae]CAG7655466.1 hypothetical protein PAECIP111802_06114 [Paenibacillus allorhizosphaerae]